jgi:hypothetical protein
MDREALINQLMVSRQLPRNIAEAVVDDDGIDDGKLQIALAGAAWGRNPVSTAAPGLVQALVDAYWQAEARRDVAAMLNLKDRIHKLGGQLGPRKA